MKSIGLFLCALMMTPAMAAAADPAVEGAIRPQVQKIVEEISAERIHDTVAKLVSFGTRNTLSAQDDPEHGVGAARKWIFAEFQSYSPRLQVRYDHWRVKKTGRIFKDADLYNVIAVLPGKTMPEVEVVVSAHYDSINIGKAPAQPAKGASDNAVGERPLKVDWAKSAELPAPGACDDGSGIAAVMELARVMSRYEFSKTLVFIAFAGEEQGLVGSTLEAAKAKQDGTAIEAVLNNDIIGTDVTGNGRTGNSEVNVYSDDQADSRPQELARYVEWAGARYLPSLKVNVQFAQDRLGRGGDQTPFQQQGFSAVRITTPNEIYANQHHETDTLENMSVPYTTRVARLNAAAAAALAMAPRTPDISITAKTSSGSETDGGKSAAAGATAKPAETAAATPPALPRKLPMISRGKGYDAVLRWHAAAADANLKGYAVVMKPTAAPAWEQEIFVGKVTEFTLEGVSIDSTRFGVKAIGNDGTESLVAAYVYPPRAKVEYKTEQ
ncbi:MAG: M28 family peptidase [Bryobacteraceae bacterium]|jgi:hypothetical protein